MFNIENILRTADLRELVERAGGRIDKNGRTHCPIHGGVDSNAFCIYRKDGKDLWVCFSGDCGGGDAITFVQKWQGMDFKQACAFLGGDIISDPVAMAKSAADRLERARVEHEAARMKVEARRHELQIAQKHLYYHETMQQWARDMWQARGIDEGLQDFWTLGACQDFVINGDYHTPTLTIPIFSEHNELLNIKHRLVNPQKLTDKYRPDTSGLGAFPPLLAVPSMGFDGELIVVVEGEIKAMVTWSRTPSIDIQVIGVGGKSMFMGIAERIKGKRVLVIPDPGGEKEAVELARNVGGRILQVPEKIDDYILANELDSNKLYNLFRQARKA